MFPLGIDSDIMIVAVRIKRRRTMIFFVDSFMLMYGDVLFKIGYWQNFKKWIWGL